MKKINNFFLIIYPPILFYKMFRKQNYMKEKIDSRIQLVPPSIITKY